MPQSKWMGRANGIDAVMTNRCTTRRIIGCARLLAMLVFIGAGGTSITHAQSHSSDQTLRGGRNVIAVVPRSWPPQYSTDENGKPTGFAIDIMEAIAARAGLTVTYKTVENFPKAINALKRGEADLIPNMGILPQRMDGNAFTAPLETFRISIFVRDDTQDLSGEGDLVGRKLAVVKNNIGLFMFGKRKDIDLNVFPDARTALFELVAGHVDALVYPQSVLLALAREIGIDDRIKTVGQPLKEIKRGIQVRKENVALLAVLDKAVKDYVRTSAYQQVYTKWYGKENRIGRRSGSWGWRPGLFLSPYWLRGAGTIFPLSD